MSDPQNSNILHLISDILDRLIASCESNAQSNSALNQSASDIRTTLTEIRSYFTNGFRSELKQHIDNKFNVDENIQREIKDGIKSMNEKVDRLSQVLSSPSFWIKLVGAIVISLAALVIAAAKIMEELGG